MLMPACSALWNFRIVAGAGQCNSMYHRRLTFKATIGGHLSHRTLPRLRTSSFACNATDRKHDNDMIGPGDNPTTLRERLQDVRWVPSLAALAVMGGLLGPPMDGFHSNVSLLEYDVFPITLGSWRTSLADVPLLGLYYSVAGALVLVLDRLWPSKAPPPQPSAATIALQFGFLAAYLQLSAVLYSGSTSYVEIWAVLATLAIVGWRLNDGSKQAAALGILSFLVCPAAEALLMHFAGVWHYPRADLFIGGEGVVSWFGPLQLDH